MVGDSFQESAIDAIRYFRGQLSNGKVPLVVFVHPPKIIGDSAEKECIEIFSDSGELLPFVKISGVVFGKDNNYAPAGGFTPLAFSILSTVLEKKGFKSIILELSHSVNPVGAIKSLKAKLEYYGYAIIWGFTATSPSNRSAMELAKTVKTKDNLVLFGGVHATVSHKFAIRNCNFLDFIFLGESEYTLPALLEHIIFSKSDLDKIPGITFRAKDGFHFGERMRLAGSDIDFPAFKFLSFDKIPDIWGEERVFRVQSTRGCKYGCSFCAQAIRLQEASLTKLSNYLAYLSENYRNKKINIFFEDATFTSNRLKVVEFCEMLLRLKSDFGLEVSWGCQTRGDCLDDELVEKMAATGCRYVYIGVESLNKEGLIYVKKGINFKGYATAIDKIEATIKKLKSSGVLVGCSIIVGLPTDTPDKFAFTLARIDYLCVHLVFLESMKIFPQTKMASEMLIKSNGSEDDLISKYYSKIDSVVDNPEDLNCVLSCAGEKLAAFYGVAEKSLAENYVKLSSGLYLREKLSEHSEQV